jgi:CheY-like chemotaxis protein
MLSKLNCTSEVAINGAEAVERVKAARGGTYSLILMDLRMPQMDGFEATEKIKNVLKFESPIAAITGETGTATQELCNKIGMDGFYHKPMKKEMLKAILERHIGHKVVTK